MKDIAVILLVIILSGVVLQPITEFGVVLTEKIQMDSTLGNSLAVAKNDSIVIDDLRNLDFTVDQGLFISSFIQVFEDGLDLNHLSTVNGSGVTLTFSSNSGKRNNLVVNLIFTENIVDERTTTTVQAKVTTAYKLKNDYLIIAKNAGKPIDYNLVSEKTQILKVTN